MKKILLVIDQPLLAIGLCGLLKTELESFEIHLSKSRVEMIEMLERNEYQLIMINSVSFQSNLVMQVRELRPALPILVFADSFDSVIFQELYKCGALAVFNLHDNTHELSFAINQALDNNIYMANCFKLFLLNSSAIVNSTAAFERLTRRESEIAKLMLTGKKMWEISTLLDLKASTVTTFKTKIYSKLGVTNLLELDQIAKENCNLT